MTELERNLKLGELVHNLKIIKLAEEEIRKLRGKAEGNFAVEQKIIKYKSLIKRHKYKNNKILDKL